MILFRKFRYNAIIILALMFAIILAGCSQTDDPLILKPGDRQSHVILDYKGLDKLLNASIQFSGENLDAQVSVDNVKISLLNGNERLAEASTDLEGVILEPGQTTEYSFSPSDRENLFKDIDLGSLSDSVNKVELKFNFDKSQDLSVSSDLYIARSPVIFVSAVNGNSSSNVAKDIFDEIDVPYSWSNRATVEHLQSGVGFPAYVDTEEPYLRGRYPDLLESNSNEKLGTPYKTIVLVIASSFVSDMDSEIQRINEIISWARENNVAVIGMHYEFHVTEIIPPVDVDGVTFYPGYEKVPNTPSAEKEALIEAILPQCDLFIAMDNDTYTEKIKALADENDISVEFADTTSLIHNSTRSDEWINGFLIDSPSVDMTNLKSPIKRSSIKNIYPYSKDIFSLFESIFKQ